MKDDRVILWDSAQWPIEVLHFVDELAHRLVLFAENKATITGL